LLVPPNTTKAVPFFFCFGLQPAKVLWRSPIFCLSLCLFHVSCVARLSECCFSSLSPHQFCSRSCFLRFTTGHVLADFSGVARLFLRCLDLFSPVLVEVSRRQKGESCWEYEPLCLLGLCSQFLLTFFCLSWTFFPFFIERVSKKSFAGVWKIRNVFCPFHPVRHLPKSATPFPNSQTHFSLPFRLKRLCWL